MCCGKLPEKQPHGDGWNTHRMCLDTRETGHGIFDLQLNWGDVWNLKRVLDAVNLSKEDEIDISYSEPVSEETMMTEAQEFLYGDTPDIQKAVKSNHWAVYRMAQFALYMQQRQVTDKLVECFNCHEQVKMISTGEFCPKCMC